MGPHRRDRGGHHGGAVTDRTDKQTGRAAVDTVVFDVGGVLLEWDPMRLYRRLLADEQEARSFLDDVCTTEWNREQDRGRPLAVATALLEQRHPDRVALIRAYYRRWDEMLAGSVGGSVRLLDELRAAAVPCYALTNFSAELFPRARQRYPFLHAFNGVVVSGREGVIKPDPAIYRRLLARYSLDPARTFFVDDVQANIDAARRLGLVAHRFTGPDALREALASHGLPVAA